MNLLKPQGIEETVLSCLSTGSRQTTALLQELRVKYGPITKQGFYAALRKLKKEEIIVIYKKTVTLNSNWVAGMQQILESMGAAYATGTGPDNLLALADKESVSYVFLSTRHLDVFWGHAQNLLVRNVPVSEPVYAYDPHYWFYIARMETEQGLLDEMAKSGRQFLMTVGGDTALDRAQRKDFQTDYQQYHIDRAFESPNYYVTAIGDYIIEVSLDPRISERVEAIYKSNAAAAATADLQQLLNLKSRNKIRISKNRAKSKKLKATLGKNFFIRRPDVN